jgi:predicted outer membrane repeat protein
VVNTTADEALSGSAPPHTCQDTNNHAQCSLRAAFTAANDDFTAASHQWDVIKVPAGNYILHASTDPLYTDEAGNLSIEGAGPGKSIINGATDGFDDELAYEDDAGTWSVSGMTFDGGYESGGYGGAVYLGDDSSASFTDCSFTNNESSLDGGAIYGSEYGALSVTDSTFSHNSAGEGGGAIYDASSAPLTLSGDNFSHNSVTDNSANYSGGAVYANESVTVNHSTFGNNTTLGFGGGIDATEGLTGTDDAFDGNVANSESGGGIYSAETISLSDSSFKGNSADDGGGIYVGEIGYLNADTFTSDGAEYGSDIYNYYQLDLTNSTLTKGVAGESGGSIYSDDATLYMTNDTITDSTARGAYYYAGGGVSLYEGYAELQDVTLKGNHATSGSGYGGGLGCQECYVGFANDQILNNGAGYAGGGIAVYDKSYITVDNSTIDGNTSNWGGGIFSYDDNQWQINDSTIDNNNDTEYWGGGASFNGEDTLFISNSTIAGNKDNGSDGYGGGLALYAYSDPVYGTLVNDTIANNSATYGGGIYLYDSGLTVESSTIADNDLFHETGAYGGGIYENTSTLSSTDSIWANNQGYQCAYDTLQSDGGFNLDSDNTCGFAAAGDQINKPANLVVLTNNGGPTQTILPLSTSLAVSGGGTSCSGTDQRGMVTPTGVSCSIGAVFVTASKATLKASKASIVKGREQVETLTVTVTGKLKGVQPAGSVQVLEGKKVVCVVTLKGVGKSLASVGTCTLKASTLSIGTASLTAHYAGFGELAGSVSTTVKVKVT